MEKIFNMVKKIENLRKLRVVGIFWLNKKILGITTLLPPFSYRWL